MYHSGLIIAKNVTNMARHEPEDGGVDGGASVFVDVSVLNSLLSAVATAATGSEDSDTVLSLLASEIGSCSTTVICLVMSVDRLAVWVETAVNGGTGTAIGVASAVESVDTLRTVTLLSCGGCSLVIVSGATLSLLDALLFFFLVSAWRRTMERWYLYQSSDRCFLTQLSRDISQSPGSSVSATSESLANSNASIVD